MDAERIVLIIMSVIFGTAAVFCFLIAYRHHKERGFILTNKWLYASKKEREAMDSRIKKVEYRVGRNIFSMIGAIISIFAIYFQLGFSLLLHIGYVLMVLVVIYAIRQWIVNGRLYKSIEGEKR